MQVTCEGNIGQDIELRYVGTDNVPVLNLSIAEDRLVTRQGSSTQEKQTSWYRWTLWRNLALNVASSCKKGDRLVLNGYAVQRTYEAADGSTRSAIEFTATSVGVSARFGRMDITKTAGPNAVPVMAGAPAPVADQEEGEEPF